MTDDEESVPGTSHGFDDLVEELGAKSSFVWDEEETDTKEEEQTRPVVIFRVGTDLFAIPGDAVREVIGVSEATQLPGAPAHIQGITVVRRQVVGLLSLRSFLDIDDDAPLTGIGQSRSSEDDAQSTKRTLIVETAHYTVGLSVDEVTGLEEWPESLLDPETVPDNLRHATGRYARGARSQDDDLCIFLDLESLLDDAAVQ